MKNTKKQDERRARLKEVNEQELRRVMGGLAECGECLCGTSGSSTQYDNACTC